MHTKRQLRRVILLPAVKAVFDDTGNTGIQYITRVKRGWKFRSLYRKISDFMRFRSRYETVPDPSHESNLRGSIWEAIWNMGKFGYETILYSVAGTECRESEIREGIRCMGENGMDVSYVNFGEIVDIPDGVRSLHINVHNSVFVATRGDILQILSQQWSLNPSQRATTETLPPWFSLIYWSDSSDPTINLKFAATTQKLPEKLMDLSRWSNLVYSESQARYLADKIIYVEESRNEIMHRF